MIKHLHLHLHDARFTGTYSAQVGKERKEITATVTAPDHYAATDLMRSKFEAKYGTKYFNPIYKSGSQARNPGTALRVAAMAGVEEDAEPCFACGRAIPKSGEGKYAVKVFGEETKVWVGPDCYKKVVAAGPEGYRPVRGGARLVKDAEPHWSKVGTPTVSPAQIISAARAKLGDKVSELKMNRGKGYYYISGTLKDGRFFTASFGTMHLKLQTVENWVRDIVDAVDKEIRGY